MTSVSPGSQINALTSTRAVAAIMVFIHHFGGDLFPFSRFPSVFHIGNIAVSYFFVLSGFVLFISYNDKSIRYSNYIKKRIGRIVPAYLLALLLTICVVVSFNGYDLSLNRSVKEVALSALFLQAFVPSYPLTLNLPGWTISVEMFFYVLFPMLLFVQKRNFKLFSVITVVLFTASQYFNMKYFADRHTLPDNIVDTVFFSPLIHLSQFLLGMIAGYIFHHIRAVAPKYKSLPLLVFVLVFLLIAYRPESLSFQVGLIDPLFMLLIIVIAINEPRILNARPLVYLGEISYGIYILQFPVYSYCAAMNLRYFHIPAAWFFYCSFTALIIFASVVYFLIEMPLKNKISSLRF